ncbi:MULTISPECIES: penicillin-binding protein 1A [unclassified Bradyrhizobium]
MTVFAGLFAGSFAISIARKESATLPSHRHLEAYVPALASNLLAADGSELAKIADENRQFVPFRAMPKCVVDAFVSAEDRNFWKHAGVDWTATARAAAANLRSHGQGEGKRPEGGSGIDQQVAKTLLVGDERTMKRKIREALVALRLDRDLGKERVLEIYLNEIYLGAGAYGIAAAAQVYFGKSLGQLELSECALLAGLPKAPSQADPFRHRERALERRNYVIRRLFDDGKVSREEAERALAAPIVLVVRQPRLPSSSDWFAAAARRSLEASMGKDILSRGGFRVETTLRPDYQARAVAALRHGLAKVDRADGWRGPVGHTETPAVPASFPPAPEGAEDWKLGAVIESGRDARLMLADGRQVVLPAEGFAWTRAKSAASLLRIGDVVLVDVSGARPELQQIPKVEGALVALDPSTGGVEALVGGFSRRDGEFDRATQAHRQPGSSFKTFTYLTAITIGYDPVSPVFDVPFAGQQGPGQPLWRPSSYGGGGGLGMIPMFRSLALSRNLSSIRLLYQVGTEPVGKMARMLGIEVPDPMPLAAGLGAVEQTPIGMAAAYAAIANGGRVVKPRFVTSIDGPAVPKDIDLGGVGQQVFTQAEAAMVQSMLRGVVERGTARSAFKGFDGWFAGKTGTTNDSKDAWFVGFSPRLALAVWVGRDNSEPLPGKTTGGSGAAPIAREFLEAIGPRVTYAPPPVPDGAKAVKVDPESGQPSEAKNAVSLVVRSGTTVPILSSGSSSGAAPKSTAEDGDELQD